MNNPKSLREAWINFSDMLVRDFAWVVCVLILFILLLLVTIQAADKENACHKLYEPFVISCYESHGLLPSGQEFNFSWNVSVGDMSNGDKWQKTVGERLK